MSVVMRVAARTFMTPEKMFGWVQGYRIDWGARVVPPGGDGGSKAPGASTRERAVA
jgi:hypothetical protein